MLGGVEGAADVKTEQITGLPLLSITPDRERLARYGVAIADLQRVVRTALGGERAGQLFEGDRRFGIIVRLDDAARADPDVLARLPVPLPAARAKWRAMRIASADRTAPEYVPLGELAPIEVSIGPNQISRENGKRRAVSRPTSAAEISARSSPKRSSASRAKSTCRPAIGWTTAGHSSSCESATQRLSVAVPLTLLLVLGLLYAAFGSGKDTLDRIHAACRWR